LDGIREGTLTDVQLLARPASNCGLGFERRYVVVVCVQATLVLTAYARVVAVFDISFALTMLVAVVDHNRTMANVDTIKTALTTVNRNYLD